MVKEVSNKNQYLKQLIPASFLGSGAFGQVIKTYDLSHNCYLSVKRTYKKGNTFGREIEILSKITKCKYVVKLLDVYYTIDDDKNIVQNLVFNFLPQNLYQFMEKFKKTNMNIPIFIIKKLAKQMLKGLYYCHQRDIVHSDLKPDNILLTHDWQIKICDFDSSKIINNNSNTKEKPDKNEEKIKSTPIITALYYRAPELLLLKNDYNSKIDIFSLGVIIGELFTLEPLFMGENVGDQIFLYINILGKPDNDYINQFKIPPNFKDCFQNYQIKEKKSLENILNPKNIYNKQDISNVVDLLNNMLTFD